MDCICDKHDHRGPLDESTENCVVDGCECTVAPEGYEVPNTDAEAGDVPAAGDDTTRREAIEDAIEEIEDAVEEIEDAIEGPHIDAGPVDDEVTPLRPTDSALKEDWVAYAVLKGMGESDAALLTKADLIARFG